MSETALDLDVAIDEAFFWHQLWAREHVKHTEARIACFEHHDPASEEPCEHCLRAVDTHDAKVFSTMWSREQLIESIRAEQELRATSP